MVPKIPRISKHPIVLPITDRNHYSLTQNPLCDKTKPPVWQAFPTENSLSLPWDLRRDEETEQRPGICSTIARKGPRVFNDQTVYFHHSISLPVSNFLLTFGPECEPKALSLSTRMRTPRSEPPIGSCGPASLGLGFSGGQAHGTLLPAPLLPFVVQSSCHWEAQPLRLCSPPLTHQSWR